MVGKRAIGLGMAALALSGSTGCFSPPPDAEARLLALEAEGQKMDEALDTVEERLLGSQAQVQLWQELGRRHRQVSAVHCQHADEHTTAILAHQQKQEEKARLNKRRSVAAVDTAVLTSGKVAQSGHN
ncbi:hypothetical protein [Stigmatella aurantiaca]|uniref:Conserved uncharacterized protein n=1 Tax=Stigmatella aurantiaca (strain DW4/3-1) TaxID=378806 RepID=Q099Q0_STIAD|nr:hypothetical protein [Stigmatella aurantiaca]ADO75864.1 conserved uncharacterized protein [Stigmatella aurantiaca DW4/3-1]EAU68477.1 hypothetical protein STIAU_3298 [Stigmatella aurantiaca DW4/3-1]